MSGTRAKFYVSGLTLLPGKDAGIRVDLQAVSRGDRNNSWSAYTPSGSLSMTIQNPPAVQWWEDFMRAARATGKQPELFIDIYPSTDGWPGDGHVFRLAEPSHTGYGKDTCGECGQAKDAELAYDYATGTQLEEKIPAHPNG